MDVRRNKNMINYVAAQRYIDDQNAKAFNEDGQPLLKKDGTPKKPRYKGWKATYEDIDGDEIPDNVVYDERGKARFVEGYYVNPRNPTHYADLQNYYQTYPAVSQRKNKQTGVTYNKYQMANRASTNKMTVRDIYTSIFDVVINALYPKGITPSLKNNLRLNIYRDFVLCFLKKANITFDSDEKGWAWYQTIMKSKKEKAGLNDALVKVFLADRVGLVEAFVAHMAEEVSDRGRMIDDYLNLARSKLAGV
jgi:hypothetical protein